MGRHAQRRLGLGVRGWPRPAPGWPSAPRSRRCRAGPPTRAQAGARRRSAEPSLRFRGGDGFQRQQTPHRGRRKARPAAHQRHDACRLVTAARQRATVQPRPQGEGTPVDPALIGALAANMVGAVRRHGSTPYCRGDRREPAVDDSAARVGRVRGRVDSQLRSRVCARFRPASSRLSTHDPHRDGTAMSGRESARPRTGARPARRWPRRPRWPVATQESVRGRMLATLPGRGRRPSPRLACRSGGRPASPYGAGRLARSAAIWYRPFAAF